MGGPGRDGGWAAFPEGGGFPGLPTRASSKCGLRPSLGARTRLRASQGSGHGPGSPFWRGLSGEARGRSRAAPARRGAGSGTSPPAPVSPPEGRAGPPPGRPSRTKPHGGWEGVPAHGGRRRGGGRGRGWGRGGGLPTRGPGEHGRSQNGRHGAEALPVPGRPVGEAGLRGQAPGSPAAQGCRWGGRRGGGSRAGGGPGGEQKAPLWSEAGRRGRALPNAREPCW